MTQPRCLSPSSELQPPLSITQPRCLSPSPTVYHPSSELQPPLSITPPSGHGHGYPPLLRGQRAPNLQGGATPAACNRRRAVEAATLRSRGCNRKHAWQVRRVWRAVLAMASAAPRAGPPPGSEAAVHGRMVRAQQVGAQQVGVQQPLGSGFGQVACSVVELQDATAEGPRGGGKVGAWKPLPRALG